MELKINPSQIVAIKGYKPRESERYTFVPLNVKKRLFRKPTVKGPYIKSCFLSEDSFNVNELSNIYFLENEKVMIKRHLKIWLSDGSEPSGFYFNTPEGMQSEYLRLTNLAGLTVVKNK